MSVQSSVSKARLCGELTQMLSPYLNLQNDAVTSIRKDTRSQRIEDVHDLGSPCAHEVIAHCRVLAFSHG